MFYSKTLTNFIAGVWKGYIKRHMNRGALDQFERIRIVLPHTLSRDDLVMMTAMFRFLADEYPLDRLSRFTNVKEFSMTKPNLDNALGELYKINRQYLEKGEPIPPQFIWGLYDVTIGTFLLDGQGRYISFKTLSEYFAELLRLLANLLEQNLEEDGDAQHNLRQLSELLCTSSAFGLMLCDDFRLTVE